MTEGSAASSPYLHCEIASMAVLPRNDAGSLSQQGQCIAAECVSHRRPDRRASRDEPAAREKFKKRREENQPIHSVALDDDCTSGRKFSSKK